MACVKRAKKKSNANTRLDVVNDVAVDPDMAAAAPGNVIKANRIIHPSTLPLSFEIWKGNPRAMPIIPPILKGCTPS
jgi:hypothetical protein